MSNAATIAALDVRTPEEAGKHVTIWNRHECRKIAGNAAPLRRNLQKYLNKHPECEVYDGQDKDPNRAQAGSIDPVTGETVGPQNEHVPIWHKIEQRKVTGNAAPLKKNLQTYLRKHPECEVYDGQDKRRGIPIPGQSTSSTTNEQQPRSVQFAPAKPLGNTSGPSCYCGTSGSMIPPNNPGFTSIDAAVRAASSGVTAGTSAGGNPSSAQRNQGPAPHTRLPLAPEMSVWFQAMQQHQNSCAHGHVHSCKNHEDVGTPPETELTYKEMASSWSNHPTWCSIFANPSFYTSTGGEPPPSSSPPDSLVISKGIPIPGRSADRVDCTMGTSLGTSIGAGPSNPNDMAFLFDGASRAPQSMDIAEPMDFSPSQYLKISASPQHG